MIGLMFTDKESIKSLCGFTSDDRFRTTNIRISIKKSVFLIFLLIVIKE